MGQRIKLETGSSVAACLTDRIGELFSPIYRHFIQPKSDFTDDRRQEFMFNTLLMGLLLVSIFALVVSVTYSYPDSIIRFGSTLVTTLCFTSGIVVLLALSRSGKIKIAIYLFLALFVMATFQLLLQWGYMLPIVLLLEVLLIVVAGVLMSARQSLYFAGVIVLVTIIAGYFSQTKVIAADTSWMNEPYYIGDAIGFASIFAMIGIVSWLSNREIDHSLSRARSSEKALAIERDGLEIKVAERTRQLEEAQLVRIMELQKFAEFGRLNANLLHEIANPLTAASLNLELLGKGQSDSVRQAQKNLKHLERYITAARHQICGSEVIARFSIRTEIVQLLAILRPRAKTHKISILYRHVSDISLRGNAVKFNQLMSNLIVNAIDAFAKSSDEQIDRAVEICVMTKDEFVVITVRDNGSGIPKEILCKIFEPFFTTKTADNRSLGIGLVMVKQYAEEDFNGNVEVISTDSKGTIFTVRLRDAM